MEQHFNNYENTFTDVRKSSNRNPDSLDTLWGWICLILGYFFCRSFPAFLKPLYGLIFIILLYLSTTIILVLKKAKFGKAAICVAVSGVAVAGSLFLSGNMVIHIFGFCYAFFAYCYYVCAATENRLEGGLSSYILIDFIKAVFVVPFCSINRTIAVFRGKKGNKLGSIVGRILVGVLITVIPTAIVFSLLSFDGGFLRLLSRIFDFKPIDIAKQIASIIFAIPIGAYLLSLFISAFDKKAKKIITLKDCKDKSQKASIAPVITVLTATIPLLFLYVVFFISQWKYYVSGFFGELPENINYATYARDGFFQLLAVSAINFVIIAAISFFVKKKNKIEDVLIRILNIIICIFTLILISTAISKLVLYINEYGLTSKRLHAFWFMMVLTLIFIAVILKQFIVKIKLIPIAFIISVVMFFVLSVSGGEGAIAKYNVDRYLDGSLDEIIVSDSGKPDDATIPQYVRLEKELLKRVERIPTDKMSEYIASNDFKTLVEIKFAFEKYSAKSEYDWYEITLPRLMAKSAMSQREH